MADDEPGGGIERVGRPARPGLWVAGWLAVIVGVAGVAFLGASAKAPLAPETAATAAAAVSIAPSATAPRPRREVRPVPSRPPLGEDGLVGGLVFGTAWPPD